MARRGIRWFVVAFTLLLSGIGLARPAAAEDTFTVSITTDGPGYVLIDITCTGADGTIYHVDYGGWGIYSNTLDTTTNEHGALVPAGSMCVVNVDTTDYDTTYDDSTVWPAASSVTIPLTIGSRATATFSLTFNANAPGTDLPYIGCTAPDGHRTLIDYGGTAVRFTEPTGGTVVRTYTVQAPADCNMSLASGDYSAQFAGGDVTASEGNAAFSLPATLAVTITLSRVDNDGVPVTVENAAPNGGDGNSDGVSDADQFDVTSVASASGTYVTLDSGGYGLSQVTAVDAASLPEPVPAGYTPTSPVIGFAFYAVPIGGTRSVVMHLPAPATSYWKYQADVGWTDATSLVVFSAGGTIATLTLTDGAFGDQDGIANGFIVDPGMFAQAPPPAAIANGFLAPVSGGALRVSAGQTVPLKWTVTDSNGQPVLDRSMLASLTVLPGTCATPAVTAPITLATASTGTVAIDQTGWKFAWKTNKRTKGCAIIELVLVGGSTIQANITLV